MSPTGRPFDADFDVHGPCAVHGLEPLRGLRRSRLSKVGFFAGLTGLTTMLFYVWRPVASIPAHVPVTLESAVLCASLITVSALFAVAWLWPGKT